MTFYFGFPCSDDSFVYIFLEKDNRQHPCLLEIYTYDEIKHLKFAQNIRKVQSNIYKRLSKLITELQ